MGIDPATDAIAIRGLVKGRYAAVPFPCDELTDVSKTFFKRSVTGGPTPPCQCFQLRTTLARYALIVESLDAHPLPKAKSFCRLVADGDTRIAVGFDIRLEVLQPNIPLRVDRIPDPTRPRFQPRPEFRRKWRQ